MTTIQYSPTELLLQIFKYVPRSTLLNCATVCRTWQAPAIQLFYESVELSEKTKPVWLHIVNEETPCLQNVGVFVKKLTVSLAFSTTMTQADFLKVLSYLPFVKSIDLNLSGYKLHYLAYLNKRGQDCVTYLEDIDTGDLFTDYQMQQYFLCAYSFRHSLKNLTLRNPYSSYVIGQQPTSVLSLIKDFENLNHLSVISDAPADNNELLLLMNSFQGCPTLTHLSYKNNYLQMHYPPNYEEFHQLHKKLVSRAPFHLNLQTIELNLPILTEHYVRNILCSFPLHLNALCIYMTHTDYKTWIQNCNELFGAYLGYVKNLKISISNFNRRGGYGNTRQRVGSYEDLSKYWQFMKSIVRQRRVLTQVKFTNYKSGSRPDLLIERDESHLSVSYNSDELQDFHVFVEELSLIHSVQSPSQQTTNDLTYPNIHFDSLVLGIISTNINSLKKQLDALGSLLSSHFVFNTPQSILILFPNNANSTANPASLRDGDKYIDYRPFSLLDNFGTQHQHHQQALSRHLHSLTYYNVVLKNIDFNEVPLNLITNSLPLNTSCLRLLGCKNYAQGPCNCYSLDLVDVKHLDLLIIDLGFLLYGGDSGSMITGQQVLIKVDMLSTNQVAYYKLYIDHSICCVTKTNAIDMNYASTLSIQCQSIDRMIGYHLDGTFELDMIV